MSDTKPKVWTILWEVLKLFFAKTQPAPPGLEVMIRRRMDAMRLKDEAAYKRTILPESLALIESGPTTLDWEYKKDLERNVPADFKLSVIVLDPHKPPPLDQLLDYPAVPTHVAKVSFLEAPNTHVTLYWEVLERGGDWYVVVPAPDPSLKGLVEKAAVDRKSEEQEAKELYYRLDPGILTELRELVRQNRLMDAVRRCQAKTGKSMTVAAKIVDYLGSPP